MPDGAMIGRGCIALDITTDQAVGCWLMVGCF